MSTSVVEITPDVRVGDHLPMALFGGLNVLESRDLALRVAETLAAHAARLGMPYVFKASWDKANRSSHTSFRGPGLDEGLRWLDDVRAQVGVPVLTDLHAPAQAAAVAQVAALVQIPAFLVRQTDLIAAAAATGRPLHLKKMQLMAPAEMANVRDKCRALGAEQLILCERGTMFGYHNLVVDPLSFVQLRALGCPVSFDVTHSLQQPGGLGASTAGRGQYVEPLAMAGVSQGLAALFLEVHPDPARALCDGPCATPLDRVGSLLERLAALDQHVKSRAL
ncbi:MAG: 3-deoxy-8-phosphooctulonate synthase [Alphaproteobacteria bacterium]|nr:3-deoxy-8-phosphooctulonate synthase [Alphaproteobacteria bacterium]